MKIEWIAGGVLGLLLFVVGWQVGYSSGAREKPMQLAQETLPGTPKPEELISCYRFMVDTMTGIRDNCKEARDVTSKFAEETRAERAASTGALRDEASQIITALQGIKKLTGSDNRTIYIKCQKEEAH